MPYVGFKSAPRAAKQKRRFIDAPTKERCTFDIALSDGSKAQCGRYKKIGELCTQHAKMAVQAMKSASSQPEIDRWVPVRKGAIYCSPACGSKCTYADFLLAHKRGKALARSLGKGWKVDVWENSGWHYLVYLGEPVESHNRGLVEIYPSHATAGRTSYWAAVQMSPQLSSGGIHYSAKAALDEVLEKFQNFAVAFDRISATMCSEFSV